MWITNIRYIRASSKHRAHEKLNLPKLVTVVVVLIRKMVIVTWKLIFYSTTDDMERHLAFTKDDDDTHTTLSSIFIFAYLHYFRQFALVWIGR